MTILCIVLFVIIALIIADMIYHGAEDMFTYVIIFVLWQLPQFLLGLVIYFINRTTFKRKLITKPDNDCMWYEVNYVPWKLTSGLSLGQFIFCNRDASDLTFMHEQGHAYQSKILGWFYLIVIGLPSFIWCGIYTVLRKFKRFKNLDYYKFYTEAWADKLGNISRDSDGNRYVVFGF